jgi:hypothetical protein
VTPDDMTMTYNEQNKNNDNSNIEGLINSNEENKTGLSLLISDHHNNEVKSTDIRVTGMDTDTQINNGTAIEINDRKSDKNSGASRNKNKNGDTNIFEHPPKRAKRGMYICLYECVYI